MVSKLNILQNYYHIPLEDQFTFTYDSHKYYLTNKPFPFYYQKYISLLQINPFKIIDNIYQQKQSQGFILYQSTSRLFIRLAFFGLSTCIRVTKFATEELFFKNFQ